MSKRDIEIGTTDGTARAGLFRSENSGTAGVVLYMDAFGPRPALDDMAARLAAQGYVVLVPDLFYRFGPYGPLDAKTAFQDEKTGASIRAMMADTTQEMTRRDSGFFIETLAKEGATGPIGTVGYCMGGARALHAAAAHNGRVKAAASFHGGNLASDTPDSPHLAAPDIRARVYAGTAGVDRSFPPEQSAKLAQALREAEVDYAIENYVGMAHGWAVPDHNAYDEAGAARHWKRLLDLFDETLR